MRRSAIFLSPFLASIWLAILFAAQPNHLLAEEGPVRILGEKAFLAEVLGRPDVLRSLSQQVGERRADVAATETLDNPLLSWNREDVDGPSLEQEVAVTWRPPRPDRRRLELDAARARVTSAEALRTASVLDLRLKLRSLYARWSLSRARVEALEDQAGIFRELVRRTHERRDAGEASGWELRRLRLAEIEVTSRLETYRADANRSRSEALAWRTDSAADLRPELPRLPRVEWSPGVENHPRLAALLAQHRAAELEERAAVKFVEMPELAVGWKREENRDMVLEGPVVGLSWPLPLFDRRRAERARTTTRREVLEARIELLRRRLVADLQAARTNYADLRSAALEANERATDGPPATDAALRAFRLGEADLTDLLATVRSVTTARLAALDLYDEALAAHRHLERLAPEAQGTQE